MEEKSKSAHSGTRRRPKASMAAASSPATHPRSFFNACGHDGCGESTCHVRYVGPVSHLRDHHALHAARGVAHVWTAAIVSGLAVVLTGVLAFNAQAARDSGSRRAPPPPPPNHQALIDRLDRLEVLMQEVKQSCADNAAETEPDGEQAQNDPGTTGTDTTQRQGP
jgi:hypothetical protein